MLMGTMFDTAFQRFAAAFEKRADAVYGKAAATRARSDRLSNELHRKVSGVKGEGLGGSSSAWHAARSSEAR